MMLHKLLSVMGLGFVLLAGQPQQAAAQTAESQSADTIRFGASLPLTGALSIYGKRVKDGYDFYVKHVNDIGSIDIAGRKYKVAITYYDDESKTDTALKLYEKVLTEYPTFERNDEVLFYLGYNEYEAGDKNKAVSHYWTLIKQFPQSRLPFFRRQTLCHQCLLLYRNRHRDFTLLPPRPRAEAISQRMARDCFRSPLISTGTW